MPSKYIAKPIILALLLWLSNPGAMALTIDPPLADAAQEARAKVLFYEIRCIVCQGESIADSQADIAGDIRRTIRQRIEAGDSNEAITRYLVSRYGNSILMRPPFESSTILLWIAPLLLLFTGLLMALHYFRRKNA
jgi:cytochrome c-type biogenesis protein CcmH